MRTPRSLPLQIAWHALALLIFACLPLLKFGLPWWELPRRELLPWLLLLGAYAASAAAVLLVVREEGWRAVVRALALTLSVLSVFLLLLLLARFNTPRYLLLPVFVAAAVLIPLAAGVRALRLVGVAALALVSIAAIALSVRTLRAAHGAAPKLVQTDLKTAFYAVKVTTHDQVVALPATRGGGLDHLGKDVLLSAGDGALYQVTLTGDDLTVRELPTRVPANREAFAAALGGSAQAPLSSAGYKEGLAGIQTWRFRVADVIVRTRGATAQILASHHYWKEQDGCMVVRVSRIEAPLAALDELRNARWQTLYESQPCIALTGTEPFRGEEIGGRMALLDDRTLLLTIGDQGFSGVESPLSYSQDPAAAYGKVVRIGLEDGSSELFTLGHRNPQGLYVAPDGRIWETEHASQGGDELNLLAAGANYGWPRVTYGTDYGSFVWPLSERQGRHEGYSQPAHAWLPSVGISNLIRIERDTFGIWKGDLLVGALSTRSLYRVVLDGERVVLSEPLALGKRVRDLLELEDGRILIWTDDAALLTLAPSSGGGAALGFATLCSGCHVIDDGTAHRIGPDLHGLLARDIAGAPGFDTYSPALRQQDGRWSRERLDAFLRDPQGTVPGTTMAFAGVADERERAQLVEYLMKASERGGL